MMDEKRLEQEYRKLKHQAAPDLWARIEENLTDHPERKQKAECDQKAEPTQKSKVVRQISQSRKTKAPVYGMAAAAAAILVMVMAVPQLDRLENGKSAASAMDLDMQEAEMAAADPAMETMAAAQLMPPETQAPAALPQLPEAGEAGAGSVAGVPGPIEWAGALGTDGAKDLPGGVLEYSQLQLAAWQPLKVPEQAETVPEDAQYFSEGILGDTELLCGATVLSAELETDGSGKAVKVVYELTLDQVYYAEDYTAGMDSITVKSPIIKTDGDEAYVLYQLQPDGTYLLPLKKQDGGWELLYPFAPQIQVTGDGAYLFHSGYASLMTEDTSVVIGSQEGENDCYYDRMLLRKDDNFLSDFVSLVERQTQGRKHG